VRLYIIGKLMSNKKVIAYKIYDSDTKESKLIATKDIMRAMKSGTHVLGLRYKLNTSGSSSLFFNTNIPNISSLDTVDCNGISSTNNEIYILVGIKGFEEARVFHVINANCQEFQFNINEIKGKTIIGLSQANDSIYINSKYNVQLY